MGSRLRAAALCRCSTEEESQKDALANQVKEARECIREHGWELADMYVEAKSGTTTKGRQEYNRLFADLGTAKFDIVVIKSQDRLMRNVKDWYLFVDQLVKNNKQLFMYLENKFYSPDDALITGIKAILAEEYSRDLSKKINNAHRHRQAEGKVLAITNATYGYRKLADKSVVVDEGERPLIEMIFELAGMGHGSTVIAQLVYEAGFRNRSGGAIDPHVIGNIIKNPLYTGTVIFNKKHYDFTRKEMVRNPESAWVLHEGALPAIVSREAFDKANMYRAERAAKKAQDHADARVREPGIRGRIVCGICGRHYNRTVRHLADGTCAVEWKCSRYLMYGRKRNTYQHSSTRRLGRQAIEGCDNVHINEDKLYGLLLSLRGAEKEHDDDERDSALIEATLKLLRKALSKSEDRDEDRAREEIQKLCRRKALLLDKLLDGIITDGDYKSKLSEIESRISCIEGSTRKASEARKDSDGIEERVRRIQAALEGGIVARVKAESMLGRIREIKVFPETLQIQFSDVDADEIAPLDISCAGVEDAMQSITITNDCSTDIRKEIESEKQQILRYLKDDPYCPLTELARMRKESVSRVRRRVEELKREGAIRFGYADGKKCWIVSGAEP